MSDGRACAESDSPDAAQARQPLHVAYKAVLLAAALWVSWFYFRQIVTLVLALVATVILAIALTALTDRLERLHVPRAVGALSGLALGLAAIAGVLWLVVPTFIAEARTLVDEVPRIVQGLQRRIGADTGAAGAEVQSTLQQVLDDPARVLRPAVALGSTIVGTAVLGLVIVLAALYIAINPRPIVTGALRLVPPARRQHAECIMGRIRRDWMGWLLGVFIDMLATGLLTYAALSLIGLDYAMLFAVFTALLEFVPYFGPIVAAVPPILFALTQSVDMALLAGAAYVVVQQVEGHVIVPLVMAQTVRLHPALIAVGIVVMGKLFGIAGLFVAVPVLSLTMILVQELWVFPRERDAADRAPPLPVVAVVEHRRPPERNAT